MRNCIYWRKIFPFPNLMIKGESFDMVRKRSIFILICLLLLSPAVFAAPVVNLSAAESAELLKKDGRVFLLDVRTSQEYMEVRIEGAKLIPIDKLVRRLGEVPRDRPVLVYCAVGSRSTQVAGYLVDKGFSKVFNMYGGIWGWQLRGYPVLKGMP